VEDENEIDIVCEALKSSAPTSPPKGMDDVYAPWSDN